MLPSATQLLAGASLLILAQLPILPLPAGTEKYVELRPFVSPFSGDEFYAPVLKGSPRVQNYDYDRCPHPPINTLAFLLVIDPATGYVAYPESFSADSPWNEAELRAIIGTPRFGRDAPEGLPWADAYGWEKLENAAKLAEAAGSGPQEISGWYMMAAWSVRLDVIAPGNPFEQQISDLLAQLPRPHSSPVDLLTPPELQAAAYWEELERSGQLGDVPAVTTDMALAWLYRSRGELARAEIWLERAAADDLSLLATPDSLYWYLKESIELERTYLRLARQFLLSAWNSGRIARTQDSSSAMLLGEIHRRLGEYEQALYWYGQAQETNFGMPSPQLISHLAALAATGQDAAAEE